MDIKLGDKIRWIYKYIDGTHDDEIYICIEHKLGGKMSCALVKDKNPIDLNRSIGWYSNLEDLNKRIDKLMKEEESTIIKL